MKPLVFSPNRHAMLANCLAQQAPPIATSAHFTLYALNPTEHADGYPAEVVVVHTFTPAQIDNNIGYYVASELLPMLSGTSIATSGDYSQQDLFENYMGAIVRSTHVSERQAWHRFYDNTLAGLRDYIIAHPDAAPPQPRAPTHNGGAPQPASPPRRWTDDIPEEENFIGNFGAIYHYTLQLVEAMPASAAGACSLLDAGTCFGFLPLLLARHGSALGSQSFSRVVGCDINPALVALASDYAHCHPNDGTIAEVSFATADLLSGAPDHLGRFDVVVAIHVLEHIEHHQTEAMLATLWALTGQRLIITVPLEDTPDPRFGHLQAYDLERLMALGQRDDGTCHCFAYCGGWLVLDRHE